MPKGPDNLAHPPSKQFKHEESMNEATALSIILYTAMRQNKNGGKLF